MRKHTITVILLALAAFSFAAHFFVGDALRNCCDIVAFLFPTLAALIEIHFAIKTDRENEARDKKWKSHDDSLEWHG